MAKEVDVISFDDALKAAENPKNILLGNGFSIAQGGARFTYSNLLERCGLSSDHSIRNVFTVLDTFDFEEVMAALDHAAIILKAYKDDKKSADFEKHSAELRDALIEAVRKVHPGIQFDLSDAERKSCAAFLNNFERIFTTNYDLLLYWVIVNELKTKFRDGFGLGDLRNGCKPFSLDGHCETYYLHGALHLFLSPERDAEKRILEGATLVDDIAETIRRRRQLPLFVSEGTSTKKTAKINSVPYLRHCLDQLGDLSGSLFVFGLSASDRDRHIFDAIFASNITKLFFCVFQPQNGYASARENLAKYGAHNGNVTTYYVDSSSAKIWK